MIGKMRLPKFCNLLARSRNIEACGLFGGNRGNREETAAGRLRTFVFISDTALGGSRMMIVGSAVVMHMGFDCLMLVLMRRSPRLGQAVNCVACMRERKRSVRGNNAKCVQRDKKCREHPAVFCNSSTHVLQNLPAGYRLQSG
jgi:hypothetical protein